MMMEMTPAKIGRLMKNCENDIDSWTYLGWDPAAEGGASLTATPGRILSRLSTITRSPEASPERIVQSDPTQSPGFTGFATALPSASIANTRYSFSVWITAA